MWLQSCYVNPNCRLVRSGHLPAWCAAHVPETQDWEDAPVAWRDQEATTRRERADKSRVSFSEVPCAVKRTCVTLRLVGVVPVSLRFRGRFRREVSRQLQNERIP